MARSCSSRRSLTPPWTSSRTWRGRPPLSSSAIGTGRLALPLSRRGVRVHGIELSPAMVAGLEQQPGADAIGVTIGDFATATVPETFGLAYLVRNTIMNLTTQDSQVECFRNVAATWSPAAAS